MKAVINIFISLAVFLLSISYASFLSNEATLLSLICLCFLIQWTMFIPAWLYNTEKFYDLTGSLTYISVSLLAFYFGAMGTGMSIYKFIILASILFWAMRLGYFLFSRVHKDNGDKRFDSIKKQPTQFFMTWTLQGMWVSLCAMPAFIALNSEAAPVSNIFYIGMFIFIFGFCTEVVSDSQKSKFRALPENKDRFITSGLWAYSRHPNYFGEIMLWLGISVMSLDFLVSNEIYAAISSPVFTFILLNYVSGVRLLELRGNKKWGHEEAYKEYVKKTPKLFPFLKIN
jgi:steroid 5-alpha reductase family enzyme